MLILDEKKIQDHLSDLNKYKKYLPLMLYEYSDVRRYFDRINDEVKLECYSVRSDVQKVKDYQDFIEADLIKWLEENPKYTDIILGRTDG